MKSLRDSHISIEMLTINFYIISINHVKTFFFFFAIQFYGESKGVQILLLALTSCVILGK